MIILDSNIWIAYSHVKDSQHKLAVQVIEKIQETVCIPEYVVVEVCTVLAKKAGKLVADVFVDRITQNKDIVVLSADRTFFDTVLSYFRKHDYHGLSFVDISLVCLSQLHTVETFDTKLKRIIKELPST